MQRLTLFLMPFILIALITGCAKKPAPEPVPDPMTEAYLIKHMRVYHDKKEGTVSIAPLGFASNPRFMDSEATLHSTFSADITLDDQQKISNMILPKYMLLFSLQARAWGGFRNALDTFGEHHHVIPYTSYIRKGVFYDNFYIVLSKEWLKKAVKEEANIVLLGQNGEVAVTIPVVYPRALMHYIDSGAFISDNNASKPAE